MKQTPTINAPWLDELREQVIVLRHGFARTLESGIIISGLPLGKNPDHGLTDAGRDRVAENIRDALQQGLLQGDEAVISSPFSRTRETARILCDALGRPHFEEDLRLRERFFGEYDRGSSEVYPGIWAMDREDPTQSERGVESLVAVTERLYAFFNHVRDRLKNRRLVVVTHGDPALLIRSLFLQENPGRFRDKVDIEPGAFLNLNPESQNR
ncbi:MAG: histidine phosphatase family protein [Verrucomicrobiota bacterium]